MRKNMLKKLMSTALIATLVVGTLTGCGKSASNEKVEDKSTTQENTSTTSDEPTSKDGGKILWLSATQYGAGYDAALNYGKAIAGEYGYDFQVVYGDSFNDPAGNLTAIKNAMTKDVVGIIAGMDGGIKNICDEYPELYVCGYNTAMDAVYAEGGAAASLQSNANFLGTMADGHADGSAMGKNFADEVIENGYKKVATITFPGYAYPSLPAADTAFRAVIEEYNKTANEPIEIVGEAKVLEFAPLDESWFLEGGNNDLDAVIAFCAGTTFVYPTLKTAIADGACSAGTKLITNGFDIDDEVVADIGGDGVIQYATFSPIENIAFAITMIDKAVKNEMYSDYANNEVIDSKDYVVNSTADIEAVMSKGLIGTLDATNGQITIEELKACKSYEELKVLFASEKLSPEALIK